LSCRVSLVVVGDGRLSVSSESRAKGGGGGGVK